MVDAARYVGIPFVQGGEAWSGCDCWGIVQLWYRNERRIELPRIAAYPPANDRMSLAMDHYYGMGFRMLLDDDYLPGDILLLQHNGIPDNFAVVIDGGLMLSAAQKIGSITASVVNERIIVAFRRVA